VEDSSEKHKGAALALLIFEACMAVLYIVFAVVFLFPKIFGVAFPNQFNGISTAFGVILLIYGIFRIYRVIKKW